MNRIKQYNRVPVLLILFGMCLMLIGIARGEARAMFMKAIMVCLECVGIG